MVTSPTKHAYDRGRADALAEVEAERAAYVAKTNAEYSALLAETVRLQLGIREVLDDSGGRPYLGLSPRQANKLLDLIYAPEDRV